MLVTVMHSGITIVHSTDKRSRFEHVIMDVQGGEADGIRIWTLMLVPSYAGQAELQQT